MSEKPTTKEKAGLDDVLRIYEGLHLSEDFIRNFVVAPISIAPELFEEGEKHFKICKKCSDKKEGFLPMGGNNDEDSDSG